MPQRTVVAGMSVVLAILFIWLGLSQTAYLQRGYSISMALGKLPPSVYHDPFPVWLKAGHALTALGVLSSLVLWAMLRPAAVVVSWAAFASATVVGLYDVREYGTLGSPTSLNFYLLTLGIAVLVTCSSQRVVPRA